MKEKLKKEFEEKFIEFDFMGIPRIEASVLALVTWIDEYFTEKDQWIDVNKKKPKPLESVIICDVGQDKGSEVNEGFFDGEEWFMVREDYSLKKVTKWMPLPKA